MIVKSCMFLTAVSLMLAGCAGGDESLPQVQTTPAAAPVDAPAPERLPATQPAADSAGAAMYAQLCVTCHGATGRGDGSLVAGLPIKPRSFAAAEWRFVDFTQGDAAVRREIERVIREGITDAMMPGTGTTVPDTTVKGLVDHVLLLRRDGRGG